MHHAKTFKRTRMVEYPYFKQMTYCGTKLEAAVEMFIITKNDHNQNDCDLDQCNDQTASKKATKLYFRVLKSKDHDVKKLYKRFRAHIRKVARDSVRKHVINILRLITCDHGCGTNVEK